MRLSICGFVHLEAGPLEAGPSSSTLQHTSRLIFLSQQRNAAADSSVLAGFIFPFSKFTSYKPFRPNHSCKPLLPNYLSFPFCHCIACLALPLRALILQPSFIPPPSISNKPSSNPPFTTTNLNYTTAPNYRSHYHHEAHNPHPTIHQTPLIAIPLAY